MYELSHELSNDLRLTVLENQKMKRKILEKKRNIPENLSEGEAIRNLLLGYRIKS